MCDDDYVCWWCGESFESDDELSDHEEECDQNPDNQGSEDEDDWEDDF